MNKIERQFFILELLGHVREDILKENPKYPSSWNGIELRQRISDIYSQVVIKGTMSRKRRLDYNNYCLVEGLI